MGCRIPKPVAMVGWQVLGNDVPVAYAYQGAFAEKERALNWIHFDLRSYDGRFGTAFSVEDSRSRKGLARRK